MSELTTYLSRPTYSNNELKAVMARFSPRVLLSTKLILSAGLRANELFSLYKEEDGNFYVYGIRNVKRRVNISLSFERELEVFKRTAPIEIISRDKTYTSHYNLSCGNNWIKRFNQIATETLGYHRNFSAFQTYYAKHRCEYWFNDSIDNNLILKFLYLELGVNYHAKNNTKSITNNNTLSDFEAELKPYLFDKVIGCLLSNNEPDIHCFSCVNLIEIAQKKGINLSLDEIFNQKNANNNLVHLKNLQLRADFAKYNLFMAGQLGKDSLITIPNAMRDFKTECENLLMFLEKMRVIK